MFLFRSIITLGASLLFSAVALAQASFTGQVRPEWAAAQPVFEEADARVYPGEVLTFNFTGTVRTRVERSEQTTGILFWRKKHRRSREVYAAFVTAPVRLALTRDDNKAASSITLSDPAQVAVPTQGIPLGTRMTPRMFVTGEGIVRQDAGGSYVVTMKVDSTKRFTLVQQFLAAAKRPLESILSRERGAVNPNLRRQFPKQTAALLVTHARKFYANDVTGGAEQLYREALALDGGNAAAAAGLGGYYRRTGQFGQAVKKLTEAVDDRRKKCIEKPTDLKAWGELGESCAELAEAYLARAAHSDEDLTRAEVLLAEGADAYRKSGRKPELREILIQRARLLMRLRGEARLRAAVTCLEEARRLPPTPVKQ